MSDPTDYQAQAKKLCDYFCSARGGLAESDLGHWDRAVQMCERWMQLIASTKLTEELIEAYLDDIYAEPQAGSGWYELSYQFKQWARHRGFSAKDRAYPKP